MQISLFDMMENKFKAIADSLFAFHYAKNMGRGYVQEDLILCLTSIERVRIRVRVKSANFIQKNISVLVNTYCLKSTYQQISCVLTNHLEDTEPSHDAVYSMKQSVYHCV